MAQDITLRTIQGNHHVPSVERSLFDLESFKCNLIDIADVMCSITQTVFFINVLAIPVKCNLLDTRMNRLLAHIHQPDRRIQCI